MQSKASGPHSGAKDCELYDENCDTAINANYTKNKAHFRLDKKNQNALIMYSLDLSFSRHTVTAFATHLDNSSNSSHLFDSNHLPPYAFENISTR